ncbi:MAG: hypothetical protein ABGZ35_05370 [Planctomycetaceae bacterium]
MSRTKNKHQHQPLPEDRRLTLTAADLQIEAAADDDNPRQRRFSMVAYTGGPMKLSGWRYPVVVDLSRLDVGRQRRPILLDHTRDVDFVMGQTDRIAIANHELQVSGEVLGDSAKAKQVIALNDRGFAWQASIGARADEVEFVSSGKSVEVNGQDIQGPVNVARRATLGEVSFVVLGADENTTAEIAATAEEPTEEVDMEFAEWVEGQGFTLTALDDQQRQSLTALYETRDPVRTAEPVADMSAPEDPVATLRAQLAAEAQRVNRIRTICSADHRGIESRAIEEGWDETRTELEVLRATRPKTPAIHTEDRSEHSTESIEAALCMSAGFISETACGRMFSDRAMEAALSQDLRGIGLHYLMHHVIRAAGKSVKPGRVDNDFIRAAMDADRSIRAAGGFSTISLSGILSNVANKTMLASFEAVDNVLSQIAAQADANDFKQVTSYRLTGVGEFEKVGPDGEIKHAALSEETFQNQVETYGTLLSLSRQMMINDDLGAFLRLPRIIGRQSAIKLQKVGFSLLLGNAGPFFSVANSNYFDGADTNLQITSLTTAEQMFFDQKDENGDPVSITPGVLLVPTSLKTVADQLHNDVTVNETTTANRPKPNRNPHAGKFRPVATPWLNAQSLSGSSDTAWYLLADPADAAVIEIIYLRGRRTPYIESEETAFNTLGMQWRGYFDFGVALQEKRAGVKSKGAA